MFALILLEDIALAMYQNFYKMFRCYGNQFCPIKLYKWYLARSCEGRNKLNSYLGFECAMMSLGIL